jgi:hypothetical protein
LIEYESCSGVVVVIVVMPQFPPVARMDLGRKLE